MDTILIQGGEMQLVSWDAGSPAGDGTYGYSLQGINMILQGPAWALVLNPSNNTCISLLPAGAPVPTGAVTPNVCHVDAIESVRPIGTPCEGCFNISLYSDGQYNRDTGGFVGENLLASQRVSFGDLAGVRLPDPNIHTLHGIPEPSLFALAAAAVVISTCMSLLTRGPRRAIIAAHVE